MVTAGNAASVHDSPRKSIEPGWGSAQVSGISMFPSPDGAGPASTEWLVALHPQAIASTSIHTNRMARA